MNTPLPRYITEQLVMHAKLGAPYEICGFIVLLGPSGLFGNAHRHWICAIRNVHKEPEHHWEMDPGEQVKAFAEHEVIGVYHSHPTGPPQPSAADRKFADHRLRQFIVTTDGVHEWSTDGND